MNPVQFDRIIWKEISFYILVGILILVITSVGLCYFLKNLNDDKVTYIIMAVICIGVLIGGTIFCGVCISDGVYDIANDAYITYTGEFEIASGKTRYGASTVLKLLPQEDKLSLSAGRFESGKYTGTIVYSERSKVVLKIKSIVEK